MERGLASEMMNIQETQCSQKFIFNHIPLSSRVVFVPNEQLGQEVNSGLGKIRTCFKADHTKSTIELKSETEAMKKQKLILLTKTSSGELVPDPRDVIDVQIKPEKNVKIEKKYVRTDGKVAVEFMAKVAGQLTAEVQVNGNHVSNSPLVMDVKPLEMRITGQFDIKGVKLGSYSLRGVAVNRDNSRIAVANCSSHCVHVFTTDGDLLLTYGGKGNIAQGQLSSPVGLAFLNDTDLVVVNWGNHKICIVNTTTGTLIKAFGNHGNGYGEFIKPLGVHVDNDGNILVCDFGNHRVQVFTRDGDYQYQFGLTTQDKFGPYDVVTHDGLFYVSDCGNHVIQVFEKKGNLPTRISTIGGKGIANGQIHRPWGLAIDNDHHLLVCDYSNNRVQKLTLDGRFVGNTCDVIKSPVCIIVLKDGQLLVSTLGSGAWCVN